MISKKEFEDAKDRYEYLMQRERLTIESHRQDSIFREVQIENLESSLSRMKDNLNLVKRKLKNLTIRAPISGQLTSLIPEIGESMAQGERIGQIDVLDGEENVPYPSYPHVVQERAANFWRYTVGAKPLRSQLDWSRY